MAVSANISNAKKAAILLYILGEDMACEVLQNLNSHEVKEVLNHLSKLDEISESELNMIMDEFYNQASDSSGLMKPDRTYASKLMKKVETIILKTDFLNQIDLNYFYIIANGFEVFFEQTENTIDAEEIFEKIEFCFLKNFQNSKNSFSEISKIFFCFIKNLEGSKDFYELIFDFLMQKENQIFYEKSNIFLFKFSVKILSKNLNLKSKKMKSFLLFLNKF